MRRPSILTSTWLALAAVTLLFPTLARADYIVTAKMQGVGNPTNVSYKLNSGSWQPTIAGDYLWTASGNGTSILGSNLSTFCIEVRQNIQIGGTYTYKLTADIEHLPQNTMGAGMGADKAQQLAYLVNAYKTGAYTGFLTSGVAPGVVQAAIWNLINDTDFDTLLGNLQVKDSVSGTGFEDKVNQVLLDVKNNWNSYDSSTADYLMIGLTNNTYQDQIVIVDRNTYMLFAAPAPAGLLLAGIGLVFGGYYVFRRKRQSAPAVEPLQG